MAKTKKIKERKRIGIKKCDNPPVEESLKEAGEILKSNRITWQKGRLFAKCLLDICHISLNKLFALDNIFSPVFYVGAGINNKKKILISSFRAIVDNDAYLKAVDSIRQQCEHNMCSFCDKKDMKKALEQTKKFVEDVDEEVKKYKKELSYYEKLKNELKIVKGMYSKITADFGYLDMCPLTGEFKEIIDKSEAVLKKKEPEKAIIPCLIEVVELKGKLGSILQLKSREIVKDFVGMAMDITDYARSPYLSGISKAPEETVDTNCESCGNRIKYKLKKCSTYGCITVSPLNQKEIQCTKCQSKFNIKREYSFEVECLEGCKINTVLFPQTSDYEPYKEFFSRKD